MRPVKMETSNVNARRNGRLALLGAGAALAVCLTVMAVRVVLPQIRYEQAILYTQTGLYDKAEMSISRVPGEYRQASALRRYIQGLAAMEAGEYNAAAEHLSAAKYGDSAERLLQAQQALAGQYIAGGQYAEAEALLTQLTGESGSAELLMLLQYSRAEKQYEQREYQQAYVLYAQLGIYRDAAYRARDSRAGMARDALDAGDPQQALLLLEEITDHPGAEALKQECTYRQAKLYIGQGRIEEARILLRELGGYHDAPELLLGLGESPEATPPPTPSSIPETDITAAPIAGGANHIAQIDENGVLHITGLGPYGQLALDGLTNVRQVACGDDFTAALLADGTVLVCGRAVIPAGELDRWRDIVAIAAGERHLLALRGDGTVLAAGDNSENQCAVGSWSNVTAIAAGAMHTLALTDSGAVLSAGDNRYGQCDTAGWSHVTAIAAGSWHTAALSRFGELLRPQAAGDNSYGQCELGSFGDMSADAVLYACADRTVIGDRGQFFDTRSYEYAPGWAHDAVLFRVYDGLAVFERGDSALTLVDVTDTLTGRLDGALGLRVLAE